MLESRSRERMLLKDRLHPLVLEPIKSANRIWVGKKQDSVTVAPFQCAWREELRFREAGRGCVVFEAFAQNDVTLVFREQVGSEHYHYKRDNSPNYTVILGSHRNRRLKIEVDGKTVVDATGTGLCCSSAFQSYWVSVYDGLICIGKGRHPFQNLVFQWLDSKPNFNVQYVGLSSWDKHVGYRNIIIFPVTQHYNSLRSHIDYKEYEEEYTEDGESEYMTEDHERRALMNFLESWDLADTSFVVGDERMLVPAHMVILNSHGDFSSASSDAKIIQLPSTTYPTLHALLEYIYTGQTQILESQLGPLWSLSVHFQVLALSKPCQEIIDRTATNKRLFDSSKIVEIKDDSCQARQMFPCEVPVVRKLKKFLATGEHSDVNIHVEGHGLVARSHKLILSLWSAPFAKMFTNGMVESNSPDVSFKDVSVEAFLAMLQFMYSGDFEIDKAKMGPVLIPLLLLSDQFGVKSLQRACCKCILEYLTEDTLCPILQAVSGIPSCKMLEETCKTNFSMHFDYYTTASTEFVLLDEATFMDILQHADMTVTSEEKVLDAILIWCMQDSQICGWAAVDELLKISTPENIFRERLSSLDTFLPFVRFPLMMPLLLQKLEKSELSNQIPALDQLVQEAIQHSSSRLTMQGVNQNARFQHRRSSFKELQYICDGDNNGVIYFAGTSYGKHQWVNPVLSKKITVTASSPASRLTDPKALVSRTYQATSFAGPRVEDGKNCAWWLVDLGQDHQLMCNYYTLRQDGSTTYIRSWAFQGSMDGMNWTNLREHNNDHTICKAGQFSSWPVLGPTALLPFRFFRAILTGPASGSSWNFCICYIELYGFFR